MNMGVDTTHLAGLLRGSKEPIYKMFPAWLTPVGAS